MSKAGQDSIVLLLLAAAFVLTIIWTARILINPRSNAQARTICAMVLVIYGVGVPAVLYMTGSLPELWRTLVRPILG